jgi:hypothetical protein
MSAFDPVSLAEIFASMVHDAHEIRMRMAERLVSYRSQLVKQYDELFPPAVVPRPLPLNGSNEKFQPDVTRA